MSKLTAAEYRLAGKAAIAFADQQCEKLPRPKTPSLYKKYSAAWSSAFYAFKAGYHAALKAKTR